MKTYKTSILIVTIAVSTLTFSLFANAAGQSGERIVDQVFVDREGNVGVRGVSQWENPDNCGSTTTTTHITLKSESLNPGFSEQYALLVAAYLQGKKVSAWVSGCRYFNNTQRPVILELRVTD